MNRMDEIQSMARDIATHVHSDPERIKELADQLIKLSCLIVAAVGKGVAVDGETAMTLSWDDDGYDQGHGQYLTGESMQENVRHLMHVDDPGSAVNPGVDLERWNGTNSAWAYRDRRPRPFGGWCSKHHGAMP